jgi:TolB protein
LLRETIAEDVKARGGKGRVLSIRMLYLPVLIVAAVLVACSVAFLLAVSGEEAGAAFPGKNGDIIFTSRESCAVAAISRVRPDGTGLRHLTCDPVLHAFAQYPACSADGKKIVFQLDPDDETPFSRDLWMMDANGGNRINITNTPNVDEWQPAWFPSGNKIAYAKMPYANDRNNAIEVATLGDNGKIAKTTRLTSDGADPAISPNGKRLAFYSTRDGDAEIYVMRTGAPEGPNNRPVKLTDNATYGDSHPDWSPDGSRIVYASGRGDNGEDIFVMRADGSGKKNLTRNPARDQHPVFSPDGRWVAFDSDRNQEPFRGDYEIWKMRIDGTRITQVTPPQSDDHYQPDWQPLP